VEEIVLDLEERKKEVRVEGSRESFTRKWGGRKETERLKLARISIRQNSGGEGELRED